MKALSLTQPWASLVAIGAKKIETRSWPTLYRGPIAIHAAKGFSKSARKTCGENPFREVLEAAGYKFKSSPREHWYHTPYPYTLVSELPLGAIVAVARLHACVPTIEVTKFMTATPGTKFAAVHELDFGDYSAGRWAWILADGKRLPEPIPCKGALGLWNVPDDIARQLEAL